MTWTHRKLGSPWRGPMSTFPSPRSGCSSHHEGEISERGQGGDACIAPSPSSVQAGDSRASHPKTPRGSCSSSPHPRARLPSVFSSAVNLPFLDQLNPTARDLLLRKPPFQTQFQNFIIEEVGVPTDHRPEPHSFEVGPGPSHVSPSCPAASRALPTSVLRPGPFLLRGCRLHSL